MNSTLPDINGYTIERLIASGGSAGVYLAKQESLNRYVALKVLSSEQRDEFFTERFLKEGKLIAALQHPNIITIYDVGVDKGQHYIAMELLEGGDLDQQIQGKAFNPVRALTVLRDVATCLQFVHERGVIHRDVKPANVLFRANGTLVLTDFGIAKMMQDDVKLTITGSAVGSPAYSSPEQSQGMELDARTDIYSLGVMFLEMLLGYNPYRAETYASTSMNHIQMALPRLEGDLKVYQDLINKMLAKSAKDRFSNVGAILEYLANPPKVRWGFMRVGVRLPHILKPQTRTAWVGTLSTVLLLAIAIWVGGSAYQEQQKIQYLLNQADIAVQKEKLLIPENDSALFYYQGVLEIDTQNLKAKEGIRKLANYYYKLAVSASQEKRNHDAALYITRGLSVDPYHIDLINLKARSKR